MARKRYNGLTATLGAALAAGDTAVTFTAALTHSGGTAVPTLAGTDYIPLAILDSSGNVAEIVNLTAYTTGASAGTIARAQESTSAKAHASGATVVHGLTVADTVDFATTPGIIDIRRSSATRTAGDVTLTSTTWAAVSTSLDITMEASAGDTVIVGLSGFIESAANTVSFDAVTMVGGAPVSSLAAQGPASGVGSSGYLSWYQAANQNSTIQGSGTITLGAGDIDASGMVTLRLRYQGSNTTARTLDATASTPLTFWAMAFSPAATTVGEAVSARSKADRASAGELLRNKLATLQSAAWVHIGDSTGNDPTEWLRLALPIFAADYPNVKVEHRLWNDTNQNYDAATTVQAGTGATPPALTVYNGSMPGGSLAGYFGTRVAIMVPVAPDLLTISTSHNDSGGSLADYLLRLDNLTDEVLTSYPNAAIAVSSQNPEFAPRDSATIAGHKTRTQALRDRATVKGWGYIAAAERFLARSDFGAGLVEPADGVHPTAEGYKVWRDAALEFLRGTEHDSVRTRDTGWRLVASGTIGVLNGFKCAARRVGNTVHVVTEQTGTGATGTGSVTVATLPVGMRATSPANMYPLVSGTVIGSDTLPVVGASIYTDETGGIVINAVNTKRHYCNLTYTTTEGWPSDLPGTAA